MTLHLLVLEVQHVRAPPFNPPWETKLNFIVVKFRRKRCKADDLSGLLAVDNDIESEAEGEENDDNNDDLENLVNDFGPSTTMPMTPPYTPSTRQQKKKNCSRDVLKLYLHHGDTLIQQGAELQKYYEV